MKKIIFVCLLMLSFMLVSCDKKETKTEKLEVGNITIRAGMEENSKFKYLHEEDYGQDFRTIIHSKDQLSDDGLAKILNKNALAKYTEDYFTKKDLILFSFNVQYTEEDVRVSAVERVEHEIYIDFEIDSPIKKGVAFDQQISSIILVIEVDKYEGSLSGPDKVNILVINTRLNCFSSAYYDCEK